jgi:hypothetical protein
MPIHTLVGAQLRGAVFHPDGHLISRDRMTSLVIAIDAEKGHWARTLNRFYRLARSEDDASGDLVSDTKGAGA